MPLSFNLLNVSTTIFSAVYMKMADERGLIPMNNSDLDVFQSVKVPSCPMQNLNIDA